MKAGEAPRHSRSGSHRSGGGSDAGSGGATNDALTLDERDLQKASVELVATPPADVTSARTNAEDRPRRRVWPLIETAPPAAPRKHTCAERKGREALRPQPACELLEAQSAADRPPKVVCPCIQEGVMSPVSSVPVRSVRKPASSAARWQPVPKRSRAKLGLGTIMRSAQATFAGA